MHISRAGATAVVAMIAAGCGARPGASAGSGASVGSGDGARAWTGTDDVPAASTPPRGLAPAQVPQFVAIGWDDNGDADGVTWALRLHQTSGSHGSFFVSSSYGASDAVKETWIAALAAGHEVGNHTVTHLPDHGGRTFTVAQWTAEIAGCTDFLVNTGKVMPAAALIGFRTPYLEYDDAALTTLQQLGFHYDCSIEEGYQDEQDGSNYVWPYTLDHRSPGHTVQVGDPNPANPIAELTPHAGLWELPVYAFIAPPDDQCAAYGAPAHFRALLRARQSWFDPAGGKITGFDYNLWASVAEGGFAMTKAEVVATLTYSFDQHYRGNRAPFTLGAHPDFYVDAWSHNAPATPAAADRRAAIEEFVAYVQHKPDVRIVSHEELLAWMRDPTPL